MTEDKKIEISIAFYRAFPHNHLHDEDYILAVNILEKIAQEKEKAYNKKLAAKKPTPIKEV